MQTNFSPRRFISCKVYKVTGLLTNVSCRYCSEKAWPGVEVIPAALADSKNVVNKQLVIGVVVDKIHFAAIDHKQRTFVVVVEELGIRRNQAGEITFLNQLFRRNAPL